MTGALQLPREVAGHALPELRQQLVGSGSGVTLGEPSEVATDAAGVSPGGVRGQRLRLQVRPVAVESVREIRVETCEVAADPFIRATTGPFLVIGSAADRQSALLSLLSPVRQAVRCGQ